MKVRSLRVREVGGLVGPVALEGFSGELDVLVGPNELGKSTLLKALRTVLLFPHTSRDGQVEDLRPYGGGAPLIEVDFEAAGRLWRIRKQFLASRGAVLTDLASGSVKARGRDADAETLELIGVRAKEPGRLDLLWVDQAAPRRDAPPAGAAAELARALEGEVAATASGPQVRRVRALVQARLAAWLTAKGRQVRTGTPYAAAVEDLARLEAELAAVRAARAAAEGRLEALARVQAEHDRLTVPNARAALAQSVHGARTTLDGARAAQQRRIAAEADLRFRERELAEARAMLTAFDRDCVELARLEEAERAHAGGVRDAAVARDAARVCLTEAESALLSRRESEAAAREALIARERADRRQLALAQLARLRQDLARAAELESALEAVDRQLDVQRVTDALLAKLEMTEREIVALEARQGAAAATVKIDYLAGVGEPVSVAGRRLASGTVIRADGPTVLVIDGIGRITVTPGRGEDDGEVRADLDAHREELAAVLAGCGAASVAAARHMAEERRRLEGERREIEAARAALPAGGSSAIREDEARLAGEAGEPAAAEIAGSRAELGEACRLAAAGVRVGERAVVEKRRQFDEAGARLQALGAESQRRQLLMEALTARLPPPAARAAERAELTRVLAGCEAAANEAARTRAAWAEQAPSPEALKALEARLGTAEQELRRAEGEIQRCEREMAALGGGLERDRQDGVGLRLSELEGERDRAQALVDRFAREAAAATLLAEALDAAAERSRQEYLAPVLHALAPYLDIVFPSARMEFGADFRPGTLARAGGPEEVLRLSEGTREQIAVLVRLGFARLFSASGTPAPVVLDDALVYSDDERLERMFKALQAASVVHQVIVLTCRSRSFERLGGRRLELTPWEIDGRAP